MPSQGSDIDMAMGIRYTRITHHRSAPPQTTIATAHVIRQSTEPLNSQMDLRTQRVAHL